MDDAKSQVGLGELDVRRVSPQKWKFVGQLFVCSLEEGKLKSMALMAAVGLLLCGRENFLQVCKSSGAFNCCAHFVIGDFICAESFKLSRNPCLSSLIFTGQIKETLPKCTFA